MLKRLKTWLAWKRIGLRPGQLVQYPEPKPARYANKPGGTFTAETVDPFPESQRVRIQILAHDRRTLYSREKLRRVVQRAHLEILQPVSEEALRRRLKGAKDAIRAAQTPPY